MVNNVVSTTGFFVLHFQFVEQKAEFRIKSFKRLPVDAIATAGAINRTVNQPGVF